MTEHPIAVSGEQGQRILRIYHLYRLLIGVALILLISSNLDSRLLDITHTQLFYYGSWVYLIVNIIVSVTLQRTDHLLPVFALALFDVSQLSLLFYAGGGTPSGIGNLIIVAVAVANILLRGRIGILIAAMAATGIIYLTFYLSISNPAASNQYMQTGILGSLCFAAALFVQSISRRLRTSESLAEKRADDVANLEEINALIIQRMRTGILVLDAEHRVLQTNQAAATMIGCETLLGAILDPHFPALISSLEKWQSNPYLHSSLIRANISSVQLQANFVKLQYKRGSKVLIFLADSTQLAQQAQQLKLVSLGRLTAGIAHEIRNPLGAISHAAQLLHESTQLNPADLRLAQIIQDESRRMNIVIENVLQLSRQRQAKPQLLDLKAWLEHFVNEFSDKSRDTKVLHLSCKGHDLHTHMDPNQLDQVLVNLIENGLRHSNKNHALSQVWLQLYRDPKNQLAILDVCDNGLGVAPADQNNIFEPFFTTENKGTGLGLYISRELCESNQARLDYVPREKDSGCFRISFAHPHTLSI